MEETKETTDVTRWNRKQRRNFRKSTGMKIPGRSLPYVEDIHKSHENYNKMREEEIAKDNAKNSETHKEAEGVR